MMKFLSLLSLAAVAGGFGLCSSVMGEDLSLAGDKNAGNERESAYRAGSEGFPQ